jgi:hypothetical protein
MGSEGRLHELSEEFRAMLLCVGTDRGVDNDDLRTILSFISEVVEVVEQAFRDVYRVLVELKYVDDGISPKRRQYLRKQLDLLHMRDRYRDAKQICTRLHFLSEQYWREIAPVTVGLEYQEMFRLVDEHEGRVIYLVEEATAELEQLLAQPAEPAGLRQLAKVAARKAEEIAASLDELHSVQYRIIGLSGRPGLLELLGADPSLEQRGVIVKEVLMGDRFDISGQVGAIGRHATATGNTFTQIRYDAGAKVDPAALQAALAELHAALGAAALPRAQAISAQTAVGNALEGGVQNGQVKPEALVPNLKKAAATVKQASLVVQQGTSLWESVQKLAPLVGPLVGGAHVVAGWFGIPLP